MDLLQLVPSISIPVLTLILGYLVGARRDRETAIRGKQIETLTKFHERILQIEGKELSDGKSFRLGMSVHGGTKKRTDLLDDEEFEYQERLDRWRQELYEEENRAQLWIDRGTVSIVRSYFMLMMKCMSWENFGKGQIMEDEEFLSNLGRIFGNRRRVLRKIVKRNRLGEPRWLDCMLLSDMCLEAIQRRIRLEISSPFWFRVARLWWKLQEMARRTKNKLGSEAS